MLKAGVRRGVISVVSCLINIQLQRSVTIDWTVGKELWLQPVRCVWPGLGVTLVWTSVWECGVVSYLTIASTINSVNKACMQIVYWRRELTHNSAASLLLPLCVTSLRCWSSQAIRLGVDKTSVRADIYIFQLLNVIYL